MPDDGAWLRSSDLPPRGAIQGSGPRERFEQVLAEFTERLAAPVPMRRETAVALVQQMERLSRRMGSDEDAMQGRAADLSAALAALNARLKTELAAAAAREAQLTARLDRTLTELAEARAAKRPLFGPGAVRLVVVAAALCAVLCGAVAGITVLDRRQPIEAAHPTRVVALEASAAPVESSGIPEALAVAAQPPPASVATPAVIPTAQRTSDTLSVISAALARGEPAAVGRLKALAQAGDAGAQLRLAGLYEAGSTDLARDLDAARRWTLRAARGGDRAAMYNAAIFMMEGEGGAQDIREAAIWFRRAAERGVIDAQYNLGLMYETGQGVEQDVGEARRWFTLAAKAGDATAAAKVSEPEAAPSAAAAEGASVADTQRYLAQKGYYLGPIDGVTSPALKTAAKAYVADHPGSAPAL